MGGRIWVESSGVPGEGSTFSIVLPAAPREPSRGGASDSLALGISVEGHGRLQA